MEKLNLNSNIWYIKFYLFLTNKQKYDLPKDICTLRRSLIITFLIFSLVAPLWLVWLVLEKSMSSSIDKIKPWALLLGNIITTSMVLLAINDKIPFSTMDYNTGVILLSWVLSGTILLVLVITIAVSVIIITNYIKLLKAKWAKPKTNMGGIDHPKKISLFIRLFNSYREKFCTPIKWE